MSKQQNSTRALLPFSVIEAAANGNIDAINAVLKHYEGYIAALSTRKLYDENGVPHMVVDDEMRKMLEIKLITKILTFEISIALAHSGGVPPFHAAVCGLWLLIHISPQAECLMAYMGTQPPLLHLENALCAA